MAKPVIEAAAPPAKEEKKRKITRQRSPAYPGINLETAIRRARTFYENEKRNAANLMIAVDHWGFKPKSSGGQITVAALKSFGLMKDSGEGAKRSVQLTDLGLRIVIDQRPDSPGREAAIKEAALLPKIHAELWGKHGMALPSDANLRHELVYERKFNENTVQDFIQEYKDTIRFARLTDSDTISAGAEDKEHEEEDVGMPEAQLPPLLARQVVPPPSRMEKPGVRQDVFSLPEGTVMIQWPASLSPESFEDFGDWLEILRRKIGRSVKTGGDAGEGELTA